jgi:hypothetical protein
MDRGRGIAAAENIADTQRSGAGTDRPGAATKEQDDAGQRNPATAVGLAVYPGIFAVQHGSDINCRRRLLRGVPPAAQPATASRLDEHRHVLLPVRGAENG